MVACNMVAYSMSLYLSCPASKRPIMQLLSRMQHMHSLSYLK